MALSTLAQKQLNEIQYAFGCGKEKAISYALECLHAFEAVTDNQVYNYLESVAEHQEGFEKWLAEHQDDRVKLLSN
jgi:hypothetical protein